MPCHPCWGQLQHCAATAAVHLLRLPCLAQHHLHCLADPLAHCCCCSCCSCCYCCEQVGPGRCMLGSCASPPYSGGLAGARHAAAETAERRCVGNAAAQQGHAAQHHMLHCWHAAWQLPGQALKPGLAPAPVDMSHDSRRYVAVKSVCVHVPPDVSTQKRNLNLEPRTPEATTQGSAKPTGSAIGTYA